MRARWLSILVVVALGAPAARAAEVTTLPPPSGTGIERGVALLRCKVPGTPTFFLSRGAVLEVGAHEHADVLLTTAHGLPASAAEVVRDCRVVARGREYPIDDVWHAGGDALGAGHDWAVVLSKRIRGDLHRWRVGEVGVESLAKLVADRAPVRLVMRYTDMGTHTDCRLEPRASIPSRLVAHTCLSYPGMSGSPLILGVADEPVLIGLHVGSGLEWTGFKIDMVSVAQPIDAPVIAAIVAAAARASRPAGRSRR
ncbi:MAG: hypothetical protein EHM50_06700 [Lysobacterales bacterium]|nr:MAG: hypothetical protein EHM50_06700 [Xanthomonadales bacterium]